MTYDPALRSALAAALDEFDLAPNKNLGQNFLCDKNACDAIVSAAAGEDASSCRAVEIGPGAGAITVRLCQRFASVAAVEIDDGMCRLLRDRLSDRTNFELYHEDALKADLAAIAGDGPVTVVGNLPYYITTPLLFRVLELPNAHRMVLMMQKEVADRIAAQSGKNYSPLSVAINYAASVKSLRELPPECFWPRPTVDSTILVLTRRPYGITAHDEKHFSRMVRDSFAMRRKTIWNNLSARYDKELTAAALECAGIDRSARAEQISIDRFVELSNAYIELVRG